jgi:large subunit ribosomal protein L9
LYVQLETPVACLWHEFDLRKVFYLMKVLLTADVYKHGVAGEVVDVADGFARNWLIPKKLAVKATPNSLKKAETLREQAEARRAQLDQRLNDLARIIDGVELVFGRRASPTGKLFGSVTTSEIAEELNRVTGIDINRRRISQQPIREVGTHTVPVRLGTEISPSLRITVVREEELKSFLARREAERQANATLGEAVSELASATGQAVTEVVENVAGTVSGAVSNVLNAVKNVLPGQGSDEDDKQ